MMAASPDITTCVVDIGRAKIKMLIIISAEHIYVEPSVINPVLRLVTSEKLIVLVTVYFNVYLLISIIPNASKVTAIYINYLSERRLLTYATPIIFDKLIAPIQNPVIIAKTNEQ